MIQPTRIPMFISAMVLLVTPPLMTIKPAIAGHPFHSTFTEMEWNSDSGRFEVALQLPGLQIDEELSRLHKQTINLETGGDSERHLEDYIKSRFSVSGKGRDQCELRWVGMEIDDRSVWAYFEVELSPRDLQRSSVVPAEPQVSMPEQLTVECRLLVDSLPDQVNIITVIEGRHRATAQLTSETPICTAVDHQRLEPIKSRQLD